MIVDPNRLERAHFSSIHDCNRYFAIKAALDRPEAAIDNDYVFKPFYRMINVEKACPIVTRATERGLEVLAFMHPSAGNQFVKGTIEKGEQPRNAAERELLEESGLVCPSTMEPLGRLPIGPDRTLWHFFAWHSTGLPDRWHHAAEDDFSHTFAFFWHPINSPLNENWHPIFHEAFHFFASRLTAP